MPRIVSDQTFSPPHRFDLRECRFPPDFARRSSPSGRFGLPLQAVVRRSRFCKQRVGSDRVEGRGVDEESCATLAMAADGGELEMAEARHASDEEWFEEGKALIRGEGRADTSSSAARRRAKADESKKIGVLKTLGHLYIAFVGAGILGLPYAFMRSGLLPGALLMGTVSFLSYFCMLMLIQCKRAVGRDAVQTYSDLAEEVLGKHGRSLVDTLLVVSQAGFCIAYVIFITENLYLSFGWSKDAILVLMLPLLCVLSLIRSLKSLAPFSILADMASLLGIFFVLYGDVENFSQNEPTDMVTSLSSLPFLFGVSIYCFEGVGMILPIESSVKEPKKFPAVLGIGIFSITFVYIIYGVFGYCAYGEETQEIITLNLPQNWLSKLVRTCMCVGLYFTFPLMLVPVYEITDRLMLSWAWFERSVSPAKQRAMVDVLRVAVVLLIGLLGRIVPGFGNFISLIGSLCCAMLAFIIPSTLHLKLIARDKSMLVQAFDIFLFLVGLVGALLGTTDALRHMTSVQVG